MHLVDLVDLLDALARQGRCPRPTRGTLSGYLPESSQALDLLNEGYTPDWGCLIPPTGGLGTLVVLRAPEVAAGEVQAEFLAPQTITGQETAVVLGLTALGAQVTKLGTLPLKPGELQSSEAVDTIRKFLARVPTGGISRVLCVQGTRYMHFTL